MDPLPPAKFGHYLWMLPNDYKRKNVSKRIVKVGILEYSGHGCHRGNYISMDIIHQNKEKTFPISFLAIHLRFAAF